MALAPDWSLQWHYLREVLPRCELVLTDAPGVDVLRGAGIGHAAPANFFGLQGVLLDATPDPAPRRDIDVLFVGSLQPAVQRERLAWLGRLARLSPQWRVHIATGVHGEDYRRLLLRSRIAFDRSLRGEWNQRVGEACSCGALLFAERGNAEMAAEWLHGRDYVSYGDEDLEPLLGHYLTREDERAAVAEAGRRLARAWTFDAFWEKACRTVETRLDEMREGVPRRPTPSPARRLLARAWQALGSAHGGDPSLTGDLDRAIGRGGEEAAPLGAARGVVEHLRHAPSRQEADRARDCAGYFHRALGAAPGQAMAALGLVESLIALGASPAGRRRGRTPIARTGPRRPRRGPRRAAPPGRLHAPPRRVGACRLGQRRFAGA